MLEAYVWHTALSKGCCLNFCSLFAQFLCYTPDFPVPHTGIQDFLVSTSYTKALIVSPDLLPFQLSHFFMVFPLCRKYFSILSQPLGSLNYLSRHLWIRSSDIFLKDLKECSSMFLGSAETLESLLRTYLLLNFRLRNRMYI